ncbi:MAG: M56 family metallopeptidase [Sphingomonas sp.]|uniref:M56 family metallopeptidase n=1 Tax=Sphingomonas sp. TaxID=28214 RepID=UPI0025EC8B54|nr:M56 family metallopeptidase [Sphingomonas sp.]MBY0284355.1 M56 family metallopeptidase [Sphingomonas sp.]
MIAWAIEALIASTLLMLLVLVLRAPVRRVFGAGVAYALWLLPVVRLLLPPLPADWQPSAAAPISRAAEQVTVMFVDMAGAAPTRDVAAAPDYGPVLLAIWAIGAVGFIGWHLIRYRQFVRSMLADARATVFGPVRVIESDSASGPLAFGIWRKYVAFPSDFKERYDADEQALALAHELTHHARGDLIANWVALVVLALHWFNPIAWRAFRAFRADQEMACDERVLAGRAANVRHAYGRAIVKSAHGGAVSAACHLHTINELKGRLRMLSKDRVSKARLASGAAAVAAVALVSLALTASGTQAAERLRSQVKASIGVDLAQLDAPKAPVPPGAPQAADLPPPPKLAEAPPAPPAKPEARRHTKIIIRTKDGKVETIDTEGEDIDAELARVMPESKIRVMVPDVIEGKCADADGKPLVKNERRDGKQVIIICRNRIERLASDAKWQAKRAEIVMLRAGEIQRHARMSALDSVRAARAGIVANRDMSESARAAALKGIDQAIAELEADAAKAK